jgi:cytochrome oxidase Cu insertion factor (SCO1/SenC/PrrC family)
MLLAAALVAACAAAYVFSIPRPRAEDNDFGQVGDFALTERSGRVVQRTDLEGKVWVACFVFTCCSGPCPQISGTMAELHQEMASEKDVRLVTFTVDPDRDTPPVLRQYAERYGADSERWLFLTGNRQTLYPLIEKSFLLAVHQNEGAARMPGNEVTHSTRLVLVDRRGHIRGYYDGRRFDEQGNPVNDLPRLKKNLAELLREKE